MPDQSDGLEAMVRMLVQLHLAVLALARRPPLHLAVEHLNLERMEFQVGSIDVDQLSGELNIGLTAMLKGASSQTQPARQPQTQPQPQPQTTPRPQPQIHQIWPPHKEGMHSDEPLQPDAHPGSEGGPRRPSG